MGRNKKQTIINLESFGADISTLATHQQQNFLDSNTTKIIKLIKLIIILCSIPLGVYQVSANNFNIKFTVTMEPTLLDSYLDYLKEINNEAMLRMKSAFFASCGGSYKLDKDKCLILYNQTLIEIENSIAQQNAKYLLLNEKFKNLVV